MATTTIVITHTGTEPEEDVQSFTSGGVAYGSLTAAQIKTALRLMTKAHKRAVADKASLLHSGVGR